MGKCKRKNGEKTTASLRKHRQSVLVPYQHTIIATKMALKLSDYTITEAGFGADLGAEKFLDLKCRKANLKPNAVVCVATLKALKYYGGVEKENIYEKNNFEHFFYTS